MKNSDKNVFAEIERSIDADDTSFGSESNVCSRLRLPITMEVTKGEKTYNTSFAMYVASEEEEGLYNLYFHNCPKYKTSVAVDFTVRLS